MVRDDNGVHVFDDEANFSHSLDLPRNIKIYGVLPVRTNGGMLGIFAQVGNTYKLFFFDRELRNIEKEVSLDKKIMIFELYSRLISNCQWKINQ